MIAAVAALMLGTLPSAAETPADTDPGTAPGWRIGSMTAGGGWVGWQAGRIAAPVADGRSLPLTGALIGQGVGAGLGLLTRPDVPDGATWATLDAAAVAGHVAGTALADAWSLDPTTDRRARAGLELGLGLGTAGLTHWQLQRAPGSPNASRIVTGTALGTVVGAALPSLLETPARPEASSQGARLGGATGFLAGSLLALPPEDPRTATSGLAWGVALGSMLGGAGGRVPGPTGQTMSSLGIIVGSTGGVALGTALQPRYQDPATRSMGVSLYLGMTQLQAAATGAAIGDWANGRFPGDASASAELGVMAFGTAAAAGLAVPTLGTLSTGGSAAAGSVGAWSAGLTSAAGRTSGQPDPTRRAAAAIAGEIGTITSGLAMLDRAGPSISQVAWVDALGLVGVGVGTLTASAVTTDPRHRAAASLTGGVVGLGAGLATAGRWQGRPTSSPAIPRWNLPRPTRWHARLNPGPWLGAEGTPGVALTLVVEEMHR